jgi:O-antigen ligase
MALVLAALLAYREGQLRRSMPLWVALCFLAFVGWGALSGWWTANRYSTLLWVQLWAIAGGVFWLTRLVIRQPQGRELIKLGYLVSAAAFAVWGIVLYVFGDYDRLVGPVYWPNPAATYLLPAVLMLLSDWLVVQKSRRKAWFTGMVLAVTGVAIWLTASRAAIVILAFYSLILLIVIPTTKRFWIKILFILLVCSLVHLGTVQLADLMGRHHTASAGLSARVAEVADGQSQSLQDRWLYVASAGAMWAAQPISGVGAGAFGDVHPQYQHSPIDASQSVHSLPLQVLAELGFVGFGLLGWLIVGLTVLMMAGLWQLGRAWLGLFLGVLAAISHMAVDIGGSYPAIVASLAMLIALLCWQPRQHKPGRGWVLLGLILVAVLAASQYTAASAAERAKIYLENDDYPAAASAYDDANKYGIGNPDWLTARGIVALAQAQLSHNKPQRQSYLDEALDYARRAEALDHYDGQHWQLESRVWLAQNQLQAATDAAIRALARDSNNHPEYAGDLAAAQWRQGRYDEALAVIDAMLARYSKDVRENRAVDLTLKPRLEQLEAVRASIEAARVSVQP